MKKVYLIRHAAYKNPRNIAVFRLPGHGLSQTGQKEIEESDFNALLKKNNVFKSPEHISGLGERVEDVFVCFDKFAFDVLKSEAQSIALVSHGDPIMIDINSLKNKPLYNGTWSEDTPDYVKYPPTASITECIFKQGKIKEVNELNY